MRAMDDLTKLRNHYYHEYKNALDAKVIQQRRDIQKKSDELKRKIEMKKLQEVCVFVTKVFNFVQFCRKTKHSQASKWVDQHVWQHVTSLAADLVKLYTEPEQ